MRGAANEGPDAVAAAPGAKVVELRAATIPAYRSASPKAKPSPADLGDVLLELPKRAGSVLRVAVRSFRGRRFLDTREWAEAGGEPVATSKGATIPLDRVQELHSALGEYLSRSGSDGPPSRS
jgi:hypothetical protein